MMSTQKVAITVPTELVAIIDDISRQKGLSRSKLISNILKEKILNEKEKEIKTAYNRVFSDALILKEQIGTASRFEGTGSKKGQEW
jgi:metal-responsive CopG/Arc/MetJ family transcriptional regulator